MLRAEKLSPTVLETYDKLQHMTSKMVFPTNYNFTSKHDEFDFEAEAFTNLEDKKEMDEIDIDTTNEINRDANNDGKPSGSAKRMGDPDLSLDIYKGGIYKDTQWRKLNLLNDRMTKALLSYEKELLGSKFQLLKNNPHCNDEFMDLSLNSYMNKMPFFVRFLLMQQFTPEHKEMVLSGLSHLDEMAMFRQSGDMITVSSSVENEHKVIKIGLGLDKGQPKTLSDVVTSFASFFEERQSQGVDAYRKEDAKLINRLKQQSKKKLSQDQEMCRSSKTVSKTKQTSFPIVKGRAYSYGSGQEAKRYNYAQKIENKTQTDCFLITAINAIVNVPLTDILLSKASQIEMVRSEILCDDSEFQTTDNINTIQRLEILKALLKAFVSLRRHKRISEECLANIRLQLAASNEPQVFVARNTHGSSTDVISVILSTLPEFVEEEEDFFQLNSTQGSYCTRCMLLLDNQKVNKRSCKFRVSIKVKEAKQTIQEVFNSALEERGLPQNMTADMLLKHQDTECESTTYSTNQIAQFSHQLPEFFYMLLSPFADQNQIERRKTKIVGSLKLSHKTTMAHYNPTAQILHLGASDSGHYNCAIATQQSWEVYDDNRVTQYDKKEFEDSDCTKLSCAVFLTKQKETKQDGSRKSCDYMMQFFASTISQFISDWIRRVETALEGKSDETWMHHATFLELLRELNGSRKHYSRGEFLLRLLTKYRNGHLVLMPMSKLYNSFPCRNLNSILPLEPSLWDPFAWQIAAATVCEKNKKHNQGCLFQRIVTTEELMDDSFPENLFPESPQLLVINWKTCNKCQLKTYIVKMPGIFIAEVQGQEEGTMAQEKLNSLENLKYGTKSIIWCNEQVNCSLSFSPTDGLLHPNPFPGEQKTKLNQQLNMQQVLTESRGPLLISLVELVTNVTMSTKVVEFELLEPSDAFSGFSISAKDKVNLSVRNYLEAWTQSVSLDNHETLINDSIIDYTINAKIKSLVIGEVSEYSKLSSIYMQGQSAVLNRKDTAFSNMYTKEWWFTGKSGTVVIFHVNENHWTLGVIMGSKNCIFFFIHLVINIMI